ncbi:MAG: hypothetical protein L6V85_02725 [Clostridiales bacterium]|nr:MAG: hypothetical protein L6V85_02725 [Clostridiales bacterium]
MRKKKFDETNDVSFSVETTEFGTREKRKKEKGPFARRKEKAYDKSADYHGKRRACPCDILWRLRDKFGCRHEVAY